MKRLMVVDDERPVVEGISLIVGRELAGEFLVVGSAASGREALERWADLAPDIILMDVSMPGLSGLETIRELRRRGTKAVFVLVTAYERFDIAREAVELGLQSYLLKPVSREALATALRAAAASLDRQREAEVQLFEQREREGSLHPFVEEALLLGVMLGDEGQAWRLAPALTALGIGEPLVLAAALAFATPAALAGEGATLLDLHARLRGTLRYRSRALLGPPRSGTCLALLPCRDGVEAAAGLEGLREVLARDFGQELSRGVLRLGFGRAHPWAEVRSSWEEALAALAAAEAEAEGAPRPQDDEDGLPSSTPDFTADEDYLHALLDGEESRAARTIRSLLGALPPDRVAPEAAGRIAALFGTACRLLARRGLLSPSELAGLLDLRSLAAGGEAGPWSLAAEARFAALETVLTRQVRHSPQVARALAHIKANFPKPIGLESTAEAVGVSPKSLSRLLVEETGRGFSELLIDQRIEAAKELLSRPGASIKEVSLASGYPDPNYFARLFKKVTGLPPTAWAAGRMENENV